MKKIAIMTWFNRGRNYGQTLQAFALNDTLRKLGYPCELISYGKNGPRLSEEEIHQLTGEKRALQIHFTAFIKNHMDYSVRFRDRESVKQYLQKEAFDVALCGSDQIWNAALTSFEPLYLFDFALPYRKVAYGPGMMDQRLSSAFAKYPQTAALLEDFDAVSVREDDGRMIVQRLTGGRVDPVVVLDPTLLLTREEWQQAVEIPAINGTYIFCYLFDLSQGQKELIQKIATRYCCHTVVFLDTLKSGTPDISGIHSEVAKTVSIELFLALIQNAAVVLTDSFHGTVFSIQFEREFFVLESAVGGPERNIDRIHTLLRKVGLCSRMVGEETEELVSQINYDKVKDRLVVEREHSLAWLQCAIEGRETRNVYD